MCACAQLCTIVPPFFSTALKKNSVCTDKHHVNGNHTGGALRSSTLLPLLYSKWSLSFSVSVLSLFFLFPFVRCKRRSFTCYRCLWCVERVPWTVQLLADGWSSFLTVCDEIAAGWSWMWWDVLVFCVNFHCFWMMWTELSLFQSSPMRKNGWSRRVPLPSLGNGTWSAIFVSPPFTHSKMLERLGFHFR